MKKFPLAKCLNIIANLIVGSFVSIRQIFWPISCCITSESGANVLQKFLNPSLSSSPSTITNLFPHINLLLHTFSSTGIYVFASLSTSSSPKPLQWKSTHCSGHVFTQSHCFSNCCSLGSCGHKTVGSSSVSVVLKQSLRSQETTLLNCVDILCLNVCQ